MLRALTLCILMSAQVFGSAVAEEPRGQDAYALGMAYLEGKGKPKDIGQAERWLRRAAAHHVPEAEHALSYLEQEPRRKIARLKHAAGHGLADALYDLGVALALGDGTAANADEAARNFRAAAEKGFPKAIYNLGVMYLNGEGVPHSIGNACGLFAVAAQQSIPQAQADLTETCAALSPAERSTAEATAREWRRKIPHR